MPIYKYKCENCGHEFTELLPLGSENPPCPECESEDTKKQITQAGVTFKGRGFYTTDYGGKNPSI